MENKEGIYVGRLRNARLIICSLSLCDVGPFLIVVPLTTIPNWQREAAMFTPQLNVVAYTGNMESRIACREYEVRYCFRETVWTWSAMRVGLQLLCM